MKHSTIAKHLQRFTENPSREEAFRIVDETVAYYKRQPFGAKPPEPGNYSTRCVYYSPELRTRCAIGRLLPLRVAKELGDVAASVDGLVDEYLDAAATGDFWTKLQSWHDRAADDDYYDGYYRESGFKGLDPQVMYDWINSRLS